MAAKKYWFKILKAGGVYVKLSWVQHPHNGLAAILSIPLINRKQNRTCLQLLDVDIMYSRALFSLKQKIVLPIFSQTSRSLFLVLSQPLFSSLSLLLLNFCSLPLYLCLSSLLQSQTQTIPVFLKCHQQEWVKREQIKTSLGQYHGNCFSSCVCLVRDTRLQGRRGREEKHKRMKPCLSHEANLRGSETREVENEGTSSFETLQWTPVNRNILSLSCFCGSNQSCREKVVVVGLCVQYTQQFHFAQSKHCPS